MFRAAVIYLYFLASVHMICAITPEQKAKIHEHFQAVGLNCIKDNMITEDDIANLKTRKIPTGANAPCFLACLLKQIGVMDEQGMLQKESAMELAKSFFNDEDEIKNIEDYLHSCSHVNSESVTDGEKGCERAMLSYKCMTENASKFGFDI